MHQATETIKKALTPYYPENEQNAIFRLIMEKIMGWDYTQFVMRRNDVLSPQVHLQINDIAKRLSAQEPIQYILGEADFCGLTFGVNKHVLIPRPETAELINLISNSVSEENLHCLDIGTGSGCIPIVLKKQHPTWQVSAIDISHQALSQATQNAAKNKVDVQFFQHDILSTTQNNFPQYDIIVSNPPYICEQEQAEMETHVLQHEPHLALFVPNTDPLRFYRAIALFAQNHLKKAGKLFFEINRAYGAETIELLCQFGFRDIILRKDIYNNDRMIQATKK